MAGIDPLILERQFLNCLGQLLVHSFDLHVHSINHEKEEDDGHSQKRSHTGPAGAKRYENIHYGGEERNEDDHCPRQEPKHKHLK